MPKKPLTFIFLACFCFFTTIFSFYPTKAMAEQEGQTAPPIHYPYSAELWPSKPVFPYGWPDLALPLTGLGEEQEIIVMLYSSTHTKSSLPMPVPKELRRCIQAKYNLPPSFIHTAGSATVGRFMDRAFHCNIFNKAQRIDHYIVTQRQFFNHWPYSAQPGVEILVFEFSKPEMIGKLIALHTHRGIFQPVGYIPNKGPLYNYELQLTNNTAYYIISQGGIGMRRAGNKKNNWLHLDMTAPNPICYWGEGLWKAARDIIWSCMLKER